MNFKKTMCLLLAMLSCASAAACAGQEVDSASQTSAASVSESETSAPEETGNGRSEVRDALPDDLNFNGESIRVLTRAGDEDTKREFYSEGVDAEVVNDAVYERNALVQERLNVKLDLILVEDVNRHGDCSGMYRKSISSFSDDFDVISNSMYYAVSNMMEGMFVDLNTIPYIDFTQPWWNQAFLEVTGNNGRNFLAFGELSQTMISGTYCMFFNKEMFKEFFQSEPSLYETVNAGEWTLDKLISYCASVYDDLNGNGKADASDRYGHFYTNAKTLEADAYVGGCNVELVSRDADGDYIYNGGGERVADFVSKMKTLLFENNNTCRAPYNDETVMTTMKDGTTIFTSWMLTAINYLRDMEADFGIIPMPKLDENQSGYTAFCHDGSSTFAIPVTIQKNEAAGAFLEAMSAETYRRVTPAYFETAVKNKYSRDSETSQMLDIIVAGVHMDYTSVFGQNLDAPIDKIRGFFSSKSDCDHAISSLASLEKATLTRMEKIDKLFDKIS